MSGSTTSLFLKLLWGITRRGDFAHLNQDLVEPCVFHSIWRRAAGKAVSTNPHEVYGFLREAPARARKLAGKSALVGFTRLATKRSNFAATALRLVESLQLLDDAIQLLKSQYRRRCRQRGKKSSKQKELRHI